MSDPQRPNNSAGENSGNEIPARSSPENMQQLLRLTLDASANSDPANYNPLSEEVRNSKTPSSLCLH
jgi:hypothetical protein